MRGAVEKYVQARYEMVGGEGKLDQKTIRYCSKFISTFDRAIVGWDSFSDFMHAGGSDWPEKHSKWFKHLNEIFMGAFSKNMAWVRYMEACEKHGKEVVDDILLRMRISKPRKPSVRDGWQALKSVLLEEILELVTYQRAKIEKIGERDAELGELVDHVKRMGRRKK